MTLLWVLKEAKATHCQLCHCHPLPWVQRSVVEPITSSPSHDYNFHKSKQAEGSWDKILGAVFESHLHPSSRLENVSSHQSILEPQCPQEFSRSSSHRLFDPGRHQDSILRKERWCLAQNHIVYKWYGQSESLLHSEIWESSFHLPSKGQGQPSLTLRAGLRSVDRLPVLTPGLWQKQNLNHSPCAHILLLLEHNDYFEWI